MNEDEGLLQLIEIGDQQAFQTLMIKHLPRYFQVAYRFLLSKPDAEDAVQESFMRLWREAKNWPLTSKRPLSFTAWFYRVVANCCLDRLRRPKDISLDQHLANNGGDEKNLLSLGVAATPERIAQQRQTEKRVQQALAGLPVRQRMAFSLFFYENLSYQEAASILGVTLKAFESLMIRARQSLRSQLSDLIYDDKK